jgi:hypothetical protein
MCWFSKTEDFKEDESEILKQHREETHRRLEKIKRETKWFDFGDKKIIWEGFIFPPHRCGERDRCSWIVLLDDGEKYCRKCGVILPMRKGEIKLKT